MRLPLRPYMTTGVAIAGVAVLVVAPIPVTPETPRTEYRNVELAAFAGAQPSLLTGETLNDLLSEALLSGNSPTALAPRSGSGPEEPEPAAPALPEFAPAALGLPGLGELGLPGLGGFDLPAGIEAAIAESAAILQAELATVPELLVLVITRLLGGNPDAENLLVQEAIVLALDVAHPIADAIFEELDPAIGGPLHLGYDLFDSALRTIAEQFAHGIEAGDIPARVDPMPAAEGSTLVAAAAPATAGVADGLDDTGEAGRTRAQSIVDIPSTPAEAGDDETPPTTAETDTDDPEADISGQEDLGEAPDTEGEPGPSGDEEGSADPTGAEDGAAADGPDSQPTTPKGTPRLGKSVLSTKAGAKFTPGSVAPKTDLGAGKTLGDPGDDTADAGDNESSDDGASDGGSSGDGDSTGGGD